MIENQEITLPKLGESIVEATVVHWFKKVGDEVALDEPLLEVSTDKVNSEIPSPFEGVLTKILVDIDEQVKVGEPLAVISKKGETLTKASEREEKQSESSSFYSPAVLKIIKENNISLTELETIPRTGENGRLTKKDVQNYVKKVPVSASSETIKMSHMRKMIAENMVRSFYEAPHASLITEVDMTDLLEYVQNQKEEFLKKEGVKLSITSFIAKAMTKALRAYPLINSSLHDDTIIMKKFIHLGVAVSIEHGVLVPVIQNCETLSIAEIAKEIYSLAAKARSNTLTPDEMNNGTITLTNFGMTGTQIGIPIIRYPEVAILGMGAITKKVVPLNDQTIGIRSMMMISLTFDHRVLDGMYGCGFLKELKTQIESNNLTLKS